jgi:DNA-binding response OmpR family regulator
MATVLIVDDEVSITEFLSETLQEEGHSVSVRYNGAQALDVIESNDFDLVLLDVAMPVMSGVEVLLRLRSNDHQTLPVIILSAQYRLDQLGDIGATAILPKPVEIERLIATVDRCLNDA